MYCVLTYHLNPLTCGVAKFNFTLARRLRVPMLSIFDPSCTTYRQPLLSIKISELTKSDMWRLDRWLDEVGAGCSLRIFLHAFSDTVLERKLLRQAHLVYCGNTELAEQLRGLRPDIQELWCPGTLAESRRFPDADITVFSFGMAHKVRVDHYYKLKELLELTKKSYCLYLSTALHDGTSFDDAFAVAFEELQKIFGASIYFLGYLSDTAVYNYLVESTFFAAFFENGVRANNTSVNVAMQQGAIVISNLDAYSPPAFQHRENLLDIRQCDTLLFEQDLLTRIRERARATAAGELGWEALTRRLQQTESMKSLLER
jgi:hypothetical protein